MGSVFTCKLNPCCGDRRNCTPPEKYGAGQMNLFRTTPDGSLDKQYLRICAVHRLVERSIVSKERAIELLEHRKVRNARATVELWLAWPPRKIHRLNTPA